jgi:protein-tyrosine phosphatase
MSDAPLRIDWLDAGLVGDGGRGRLGLTILPGKHGVSTRYPGRVYRRELSADLAALVAAGVRRLILLVEDSELRRWGDVAIIDRAMAVGVEILRHPMPDGGVPAGQAEMDTIIEETREGRARGNVAIACMGGVGRTGMVAACVLVADGISPDLAVARVRAVRHPEAVETAEQLAFVTGYADHLATSH